MPIVRRRLKSSDVYPDDLRYDEDTDTIQSLINGTWTNNPKADPRTQTIFPARVTSDTNCDAAESIKDAFKGQIDGVLSAISGGQTVFTIAGIILSLFAFGPFGVFISLALLLAHAMLDAGTGAIEAVLTDPVYHTFMCILNCHMAGDTGRLKIGSLSDINSEIDSQIGGLGATILKAMTSLAGEGGMNNLASLGSSTGDCTDCACESPCMSDWSLSYPTNPIFGTIDTSHFESDGYVIVSALVINTNAAYYFDIRTADESMCCKVKSVLQCDVDGNPVTPNASYGTFTQDCNETFSPSAFHNLGTGSQCSMHLQGSADAAFYVKISFIEC